MLVGHYVYGGALFLLRNLKWVECDEGSYTMYLEMMISFQLVTGMEIPVAVPGIKQLVYQSPTVDCRLAKHHSTTIAVSLLIAGYSFERKRAMRATPPKKKKKYVFGNAVF